MTDLNNSSSVGHSAPAVTGDNVDRTMRAVFLMPATAELDAGSSVTVSMAVMCRIVQHYFDTVLFDVGQLPRVANVELLWSADKASFKVSFGGLP